MQGVIELFIDIETIPSQSQGIYDRIGEKIRPPASMSRADTIAKWEQERKAEAVDERWKKTALDGTFGEIVAIGWAFGDEAVRSVVRGLESEERELLRAFNAELAKVVNGNLVLRWVGHNITGFDLRFLWQRHVICGVQPAVTFPYDRAAWSGRVHDTMIEWSGPHLKDAVGLDDLCHALGLPGKKGVCGADVWDMVAESRIGDIRAYVENDIRLIRSVWRKMNFLAPLAGDGQAVATETELEGVF